MKLKGTFDGTRYEDLRVLIPKQIAEYYKSRNEWEDVIKYRSYEKSESITIKKGSGSVRHKWQLLNEHWCIVDDYFDYGPLIHR